MFFLIGAIQHMRMAARILTDRHATKVANGLTTGRRYDGALHLIPDSLEYFDVTNWCTHGYTQ